MQSSTVTTTSPIANVVANDVAPPPPQQPKHQQLLFTPGPLLTTPTVKAAMMTDYGSRDKAFMDAVKNIRTSLLRIAGLSAQEWSAILLQGAGTMGIEAALSTITPRPLTTTTTTTTASSTTTMTSTAEPASQPKKFLLLHSGKYAERQEAIMKRMGTPLLLFRSEEGVELDLAALEQFLAHNAAKLYAVGYVHHETSTGMVYPAEQIYSLVKRYAPSATVVVDAISSFGGIPLSVNESCDVLITSSNKCFHGVPGFSIVLARRALLTKEKCEGNARSLTLDLYEQWKSFEKSGQFVVTPPVHALMAFQQALREYDASGGIAGRVASYRAKRDVVQREAVKLGFSLFLHPKKLRSPSASIGHIVVALNMPNRSLNPKWNFQTFYQYLNQRGFVIYPGKASKAETFRFGLIGATTVEDVEAVMRCSAEALVAMGVPGGRLVVVSDEEDVVGSTQSKSKL